MIGKFTRVSVISSAFIAICLSALAYQLKSAIRVLQPHIALVFALVSPCTASKLQLSAQLQRVANLMLQNTGSCSCSIYFKVTEKIHVLKMIHVSVIHVLKMIK